MPPRTPNRDHPDPTGPDPTGPDPTGPDPQTRPATGADSTADKPVAAGTTGRRDADAAADEGADEGAAPPVKKASSAAKPKAAETGPPSVAVPKEELDRLVGGSHHDPHSILGEHPAGNRTIIRALRPTADSVTALIGDTRLELTRLHKGGVFGGVIERTAINDYRIEASYPGHGAYVTDDPYRHMPTVGEMDLYLIGEGRHEELWKVLGAHVRDYGAGVKGVSFSVWAPNAHGIRVVGDFNFWDGRGHPMRSLGATGVWELFVPDVGPKNKYKYEILGADLVWRQKADPLANATQVPPATASMVYEDHYQWTDDAWIEQRGKTPLHASPISIYEVHLGSWRQGLGYADLARELVDYVKETGFTHVELLPVAEHPFGGSWGYQVSSYYAPTSRFGTPDEFRHLVDTLHNNGIGVIVDWVPAHFPKDEWALGRFDGTPLYEHADPRRGEQPDWGTYVFDFGRREVRNFLVANAVYWMEEYHIDGLRVDAVASMLYLDYSRAEGAWLPNVYGGRENLDAVAFLQETTATCYRRNPGTVIIAEESTAWPGVTQPTHLGGLGFGFKWNMGWMHDTLDYVTREPVFRRYHHHQMTFSMMYAYSENFILPISHDEVVHGKGSLLGKMPGDRWQQLANLRALLAYMWAHPGKQLLFMGSEFAQELEWSESRSLDWWLLEVPDHNGVRMLVTDLNRVYKQTRALWTRDVTPSGFTWIDANDADHNVFSFLRWADDGSVLACITNFAGNPHEGYRIGLPKGGRWAEVINTDSELYSGSGVGNMGAVQALDQGWHGQRFSTTLRVPPLGAVWLRWEG